MELILDQRIADNNLGAFYKPVKTTLPHNNTTYRHLHWCQITSLVCSTWVFWSAAADDLWTSCRKSSGLLFVVAQQSVVGCCPNNNLDFRPEFQWVRDSFSIDVGILGKNPAFSRWQDAQPISWSYIVEHCVHLPTWLTLSNNINGDFVAKLI